MYPFGEATEGLLSLQVEPSYITSTSFPPHGRDNQLHIFFGEQMTRSDVAAAMDLFRLILRRGWGEKQIYLTVCPKAWQNPSVRNLVLNCPLGLRFMKVTVKDIDASTEVILVQNVHTGLSWRSTYTAYVDTFSADMLVTIPDLEPLRLHPMRAEALSRLSFTVTFPLKVPLQLRQGVKHVLYILVPFIQVMSLCIVASHSPREEIMQTSARASTQNFGMSHGCWYAPGGEKERVGNELKARNYPNSILSWDSQSPDAKAGINTDMWGSTKIVAQKSTVWTGKGLGQDGRKSSGWQLDVRF
ncbi:hypothetical protein BJ165DRAFT_1405650 [Panaeolus papilionaceus]|nr:hypothetical protein BJ165DRAFT_1405650 [Panaeolus papilionaceus]